MKEFIFTCLCIVVITFMTSCISTTPQTTQGKGNICSTRGRADSLLYGRF